MGNMENDRRTTLPILPGFGGCHLLFFQNASSRAILTGHGRGATAESAKKECHTAEHGNPERDRALRPARGKEWEYRVVAANKAGEGEPSNTAPAVL
jgi:hypothetical protein